MTKHTPPKIRLVQMHVVPKLVSVNAQTMINHIRLAKQDGIDVLCFPELCLTGYLIGDFWERPAFLRECDYWQKEVINETKGSEIVIIFGHVVCDWEKVGEDGRVRKYNAAVVAQSGQALVNQATKLPFWTKTLMPNYREFDDTRYFFDTRKLALERACDVQDLICPAEIRLRGKTWRIAVMVCEDGWDNDYYFKPFNCLLQKGADVFIDLSASPFTSGKRNKRRNVFSKKAQLAQKPMCYVNKVGAENNGKTMYTFDGDVAVYLPSGELLQTEKNFEQQHLDFTLGDTSAPISMRAELISQETSFLCQAIQFALKTFLQNIGQPKVVIGLSGGIDSAVSAALLASIIEPKDLILLNMPSKFNSQTTQGLAKKIAANLGCLFASVPIEDSVQNTSQQINGLHLESCDQKFKLTVQLSALNYENIQARDRGSRVLSAVASAVNGIFICNVNKSELSIGYGTLYGDLTGAICPLADLWKHQVYELGHYLNASVFKKNVIPLEVFKLVPSAELSAEQNPEEGKGDPLHYPYHDRLFQSWMQRWSPVTTEEILEWYLAGELEKELKLDFELKDLFPDAKSFIEDLEKHWALFSKMGVAKRIQAPPIVAVSSRAYGFDFRESQDSIFYSQKYQKLKAQALSTK